MCEVTDYKNFFDEAPVALCRTNAKTGQFEMANIAAAEMFGCESVQELMEDHVSTDFYPPEIRRQLVHKLKKFGVVEDEELELHLPNGKHVWVRASFRMNCGGECIECFLMDITEIVKLRDRHVESLRNISQKLDTKIAAMAS